MRKMIVLMVLLIALTTILAADAPDIWPILGGRESISSPFGYREDGFGGKQGFHFAIDIAKPEGAMVLSTMSGTVLDHFPPPNGYFNGHPVYGGCVLIVGDDGWATLYGHLSDTYVKEGQEVVKGQMIGEVGDTGLSTGPHLHYEILIDPERFLK